jgi:hypothetical protein
MSTPGGSLFHRMAALGQELKCATDLAMAAFSPGADLGRLAFSV